MCPESGIVELYVGLFNSLIILDLQALWAVPFQVSLSN